MKTTKKIKNLLLKHLTNNNHFNVRNNVSNLQIWNCKFSKSTVLNENPNKELAIDECLLVDFYLSQGYFRNLRISNIAFRYTKGSMFSSNIFHSINIKNLEGYFNFFMNIVDGLEASNLCLNATMELLIPVPESAKPRLKFRKNQFKNIIISDSELNNIDFSGSEFDKLQILNSEVKNCIFTGVLFKNSIHLKGTKFTNCTFKNVKGLNISSEEEELSLIRQVHYFVLKNPQSIGIGLSDNEPSFLAYWILKLAPISLLERVKNVDCYLIPQFDDIYTNQISELLFTCFQLTPSLNHLFLLEDIEEILRELESIVQAKENTPILECSSSNQ